MPLTVGQILQGRYRIAGLLGQGGMGAVYLAKDLRLLGRRCAIKENLPDPNASPQALAQARQQFTAEANILAQLNHPNLPTVSDYFTEAGREYLVMEYVEGEDLATALLRTGKPLPEKAVLIWADQVLDALEYLHGQRPQPIVHRDIKPANIRLMPQGKIKLVDFGLVKLLDPTDPRTKTVLRGLGTPEYSPLEQYAAGTGHTDARSDIYSLGATLYHLLTNVAPPDVHQRLLNPGILVPPRQLNPQLSENTERVVLRAMEIYPDQRYQTASEMRQVLSGALVSRQMIAVRRRPRGVMIPVLVVVASLGIGMLLTATGVGKWLAMQLLTFSTPPSIAQLNQTLVPTDTPGPFAVHTLAPTNTLPPAITPTPALVLTPPTPKPPTVTPEPTWPPFTHKLYLTTPRLQDDDVQRVQARLVELGYSEVGEIDGYFGPKTETAVRNFQRVNGLEEDGIVGPITWARLFSDAAVPKP
jgi:serine/threonine protein kinase